APGRVAKSIPVVVGNSASRPSIAVPLLDEAPAPSTASTVAAADENGSRGGTQRIIGITTGGLGVAAVVAGTIFGLQASSKNDAAASHCNASNRCDAEGIRLDGEGRDAATV